MEIQSFTESRVCTKGLLQLILGNHKFGGLLFHQFRAAGNVDTQRWEKGNRHFKRHRAWISTSSSPYCTSLSSSCIDTDHCLWSLSITAEQLSHSQVKVLDRNCRKLVFSPQTSASLSRLWDSSLSPTFSPPHFNPSSSLSPSLHRCLPAPSINSSSHNPCSSFPLICFLGLLAPYGPYYRGEERMCLLLGAAMITRC